MGRMEENSNYALLVVVVLSMVVISILSGCMLFSDEEDPDNPFHAEQLIRGSISLVVVEGHVDNGTISLIHMYIDLYCSESIDMRDVVLYVLCTPTGGERIHNDLILDIVSGNKDPTYQVEEVVDPSFGWNPDDTPPRYFLQTRTMLRISMDLDEHLVPLPPGSQMEIDIIVLTTGSSIFNVFQTPDSYPTEGLVRFEN